MGDSTSSMFYAFGLFIGLYLVGMLLYQGHQLFKRWRAGRRDRRYRKKP